MPPVIPSPPITYTSSPPDTPEASHSASTSPASSVSLQTPPDVHGRGLVEITTIPSFTTHITLPSKDAPVIPSPPITYPSSPPDTPEASHLASTSLASLVSPQTPPDTHGCGLVKIASIPSFTARVTLPSRDASRYPQSPQSHTQPRPLIPPRPLIQPRPLLRHRFPFKHRRALAWTRQDRLGRIEPRGCSGYSPMVTEPFQHLRNPRPSHWQLLHRPLTLKNPKTIHNLLMRRGQSGK